MTTQTALINALIMAAAMLSDAAEIPLCRNSCGGIPIRHPFGIDEGCGAPQLRGALNCSGAADQLFLSTASGSYRVQSVDYAAKKMVVFDPAASTCSVLQPPRAFQMTELQSAIMPPSSDTAFALLNCSADSPLLNRYSYLCSNFSGHSCHELYSACNAFRLFQFLSATNSSPPCCFTGYDTMRFMSMNILDCTHYTTVINSDALSGVGPLDWVYAIKLSYAVPDTGCDLCSRSGGTCGFDTDSVSPLCLCSPSSNHTRQCGTLIADGQRLSRSWRAHFIYFTLFFIFLMII